jgi:hypothetical protein
VRLHLSVFLGFFVCCQHALADQRIIIIGDSISEHIYCWPNEMRLENPLMNLQLLTQSGRTIRDYSPPRDLRNVSGNDLVVYFLGINDAVGGYPMKYVNEAFVSHMVFLRERGFTIHVLLPPVITELKPQIDKVRTVLTMQSTRLGIDYHELTFWDESLTRDGMHPGPELSRMVAEFVYSLLEPDLQASGVTAVPECHPDAMGALPAPGGA